MSPAVGFLRTLTRTGLEGLAHGRGVIELRLDFFRGEPLLSSLFRDTPAISDGNLAARSPWPDFDWSKPQGR